MDSTNKRAPVGRGARRGNARSDSGDPITAATLHDALNRTCAEVGIVDPDVPADGQWHPTDINCDPRVRGDGRIKLFPDGEGGIVCNWKVETRPKRGRVFYFQAELDAWIQAGRATSTAQAAANRRAP